MAEIVFGQPLARELARLDWARRRGPLLCLLDPETRRLARIRLHIVDGDETLAALHPETKILPHWPMLVQLRDAGRAAAEAWIGSRVQHLVAAG